MTVVTEQLDLPDGTTPTRATVTYQLVGTGGLAIEEAYTGGTTIVGLLSVTPGTDGKTSVTLPGNDAITPAGTRWARTVNGNGRRKTTVYLNVPATGGPYRVDQVLDEAPGTIASSALAVHADLRGPGGHLPDGTPDDGDTILWDTEDEIFIYGPPGSGGGGGAPSGPAGGALGGTYPNPTLSAAKQAELDAKASASDLTTEASARAAADTALAGQLAAEAALARNADNLTSGTVNINRLPTAVATDTEVTNALAAEAIARDAAIAAATADLIASAPGALDTLNELAAALGDDPDFATTITNALAGKQASNANLTAIAALTTTAYGRSFLELANSAAGRALLGLVIGTDVQAFSAVLQATTAAFTTAQETKLAGIATGATANSADAVLLDRGNHTGTQAIATVTGLQTALDGKQPLLEGTTDGQVQVWDDTAGEWVAVTPDPATAADVGFDATGLDNTDADDVQEAVADLDAAVTAVGSAGVSDGDKGGVTVSGGGTVWTPTVDTTGFTNSDATDLQGLAEDFDSAITAGGGGGGVAVGSFVLDGGDAADSGPSVFDGGAAA